MFKVIWVIFIESDSSLSYKLISAFRAEDGRHNSKHSSALFHDLSKAVFGTISGNRDAILVASADVAGQESQIST